MTVRKEQAKGKCPHAQPGTPSAHVNEKTGS